MKQLMAGGGVALVGLSSSAAFGRSVNPHRTTTKPSCSPARAGEHGKGGNAHWI
jgi:hypothetical protein